jgi:hypothetical protein
LAKSHRLMWAGTAQASLGFRAVRAIDSWEEGF